jgi:ATP-dependent DNA helicase RecG
LRGGYWEIERFPVTTPTQITLNFLFTNCGGGKLIFGISNKRFRQVVGSKAFEQPECTRKGLIDKLHVMVDFQIYDYDGKRVLVFDVASRSLSLPVQVDGVAWWY